MLSITKELVCKLDVFQTQPTKYDSAWAQLEVEVRKIFAFDQVRANENRLCQVFRSQMCA